MNIEPVILAGTAVTLRPMAADDLEALFAAGSDESLWKLTLNQVTKLDDMRVYVDAALADRDKGLALPFVTIDNSTGEIVGSTRFGNIDRHHRKAEIGWTWIKPSQQRTQVNTEAKFLMLTHAFETWKCIRIELKTDRLNERSQAAMKRIGATEEGILRNHLITDAGRFRDSVIFSIIEAEWPAVKCRLASLLARENG